MVATERPASEELSVRDLRPSAADNVQPLFTKLRSRHRGRGSPNPVAYLPKPRCAVNSLNRSPIQEPLIRHARRERLSPRFPNMKPQSLGCFLILLPLALTAQSLQERPFSLSRIPSWRWKPSRFHRSRT